MNSTEKLSNSEILDWVAVKEEGATLRDSGLEPLTIRTALQTELDARRRTLLNAVSTRIEELQEPFIQVKDRLDRLQHSRDSSEQKIALSKSEPDKERRDESFHPFSIITSGIRRTESIDERYAAIRDEIAATAFKGFPDEMTAPEQKEAKIKAGRAISSLIGLALPPRFLYSAKDEEIKYAKQCGIDIIAEKGVTFSDPAKIKEALHSKAGIHKNISGPVSRSVLLTFAHLHTTPQ